MRFHIPATLILAISALLSRLLGIFRDHLLASHFGASASSGIYNLDAYYAAFRIPDILYNLLIYGAVSAAIIPIFTQYKKSDQLKKAWEFASNILHLMLLSVLVLSAIAYIFAPVLTHLVAGGFDDESFRLTVRLMRILLLSPIIFTFSAIFISIQDSFKVFFYRSLAPIFYNLGIIFAILYFSSSLGVVGVTWGVILGAVLQVLIQIPALKRVSYKHLWILDFKRPDIRKAFKLIIPRIIGLSVSQITLLVNTLIASFLVSGSITIYYFADNLQAVPLGIIGISFAISSFATLSEFAMEKTIHSFLKELSTVAHRVLFFIIPASFGMFFLRSRIIHIILVAGKFTADDANVLKVVLGFLLISLFAQSLIPLFSRGFYAHHDTKTPVITAIFSSFLSVISSYSLAIVFNMGISGIAIAFSFGVILNFLLLYIFMAKKCQHLIFDYLKVLKMVFSAGIMYSSLFFSSFYLNFGSDLLSRISTLSILILLGMAVYFLMAKLLKIP